MRVKSDWESKNSDSFVLYSSCDWQKNFGSPRLSSLQCKNNLCDNLLFLPKTVPDYARYLLTVTDCVISDFALTRSLSFQLLYNDTVVDLTKITFHIHKQIRELPSMEPQWAGESKPNLWVVWTVAYAVVGTIVIVVNTLTLYTCLNTSSLIRTRKHVMVINLAVADLSYGVTAVPATMLHLLNPTITSFYVYKVLATFLKTASLFTLGVIAVERMHAIVWPIRHQVLNISVYKTALLVIWILSVVVTAAVALQWSEFWAIGIFAPLLLPIIIGVITLMTVICYVCIWIAVRRRKQRRLAASAKQDKALAVTLLLVGGAFLITWGTPILYLSIVKVCKNYHELSVTTITGAMLLFAVQSLINPVIYCFRLPSFKASLKVRIKEIAGSSATSRGQQFRQRKVAVEIEMR